MKLQIRKHGDILYGAEGEGKDVGDGELVVTPSSGGPGFRIQEREGEMRFVADHGQILIRVVASNWIYVKVIE